MGLAGYLLFFAAWVGHSALWLVTLNVCYSRPWRRGALKLIRLGVAILTFGFPAFLWYIAGWDLTGLTSSAQTVGDAILIAYLALCWAMSLFVIPLVTVLRLLRPTPPQQIGKHRRIVDVARVLGHKPVGNGKLAPLARIPGNQVFQIEFTELILRLPTLPKAWDGLTILHFSDLHLIGTPSRDFYEQAIQQCLKDRQPDVFAITGDLVDTDVHHRWLLPLLRPLGWKEVGLAILGNHDWWYRPTRVRRRLQKLGLTVLGNIWQQVEIRGVPCIAIGHEGPWFHPPPDLTQCPRDLFRLCLSHTPDNIRWARRNHVDLMLSGHVHGGQIRLPLFGSLFVPSLYSRKYDCGLFWEPPTLLSVTRGLAGKEPLRFNCRPEITRLVLKCE